MKRVNEKGQILIFITLAFVVLGLFVGLAVDGGIAYLLKADLAKKVDPAALAAAAKIADGYSAAYDAACNSARMNGLVDSTCSGLTVTQVTASTPGGGTADGVEVSATATMLTSFMRLGKLIGCGSPCDAVTVTASAVAASGAYDLVINLDDTGSMASGGKLTGAKNGANALVDAVVPAGVASPAKVSMAPFRGCYNAAGSSGCKDTDEWGFSGGSVVSLPASTTNNNTTLHNAVNVLDADGGSGTNLCDGLTRARQELFESPGTQSRANATKFIVLLTDADNEYRTSAVLPFVAPGCAITEDTVAENKSISLRTYDLATNIKTGQNVGTSGQPVNKTVTIFVILYGSGTGSAPACNPGYITSASNPENSTYWKNLASCIASSPGDVYLAPTGPDIEAAFQAIISRLPVRLVI